MRGAGRGRPVSASRRGNDYGVGERGAGAAAAAAAAAVDAAAASATRACAVQRAASLAYHVSSLGTRRPILLKELDREPQLDVPVVDAGLQLCKHQHEHTQSRSRRRWKKAVEWIAHAHARGAASPVISRQISLRAGIWESGCGR